MPFRLRSTNRKINAGCKWKIFSLRDNAHAGPCGNYLLASPIGTIADYFHLRPKSSFAYRVYTPLGHRRITKGQDGNLSSVHHDFSSNISRTAATTSATDVAPTQVKAQASVVRAGQPHSDQNSRCPSPGGEKVAGVTAP